MHFFWNWPSIKNCYKITEDFSFSVTSAELTNYNLLERNVLMDFKIEETLVARDTVIFSTTRVCADFKENSLDTYTENTVLRGDTRFINHDPVSTREASVESSEAVFKTSLGNSSVNFRIIRANRFVVFIYLSSTSITNKFQLPKRTTNTSRSKNTGVILQKSDSNQKLKHRTAVVDTKFENLQWLLLDSVSQSSADANRGIQNPE